jgi:hypothetical protein
VQDCLLSEALGNRSLSDPAVVRGVTARANLAFQAVHGEDVESSQFSFTAQQLAYIEDHYMHLDCAQICS